MLLRPSRPRAFTLIELLVVIAIVALLLALLMPALGRSRDVASEKTCASALHQFALGVVAYAQDHRDWLPVEPTEHNPHPGLVAVMTQEYSFAAKGFYCPEARKMETYAQDTVNYLPVGASDTIVYTPDNVAAGNISYIYWSFEENKKSGSATWREAKDFVPRLLRTGDAVPVDPARPLREAVPAERWVACDFFRQKAPFPHVRKHASGLNVVFLDAHVKLILGRPRDNYR